MSQQHGFRCPKCKGELESRNAIRVKQKNVVVSRMECKKCLHVLTTIKFIASEDSSYGNGYASVARRIQEGLLAPSLAQISTAPASPSGLSAISSQAKRAIQSK